LIGRAANGPSRKFKGRAALAATTQAIAPEATENLATMQFCISR